MKKRSLFVSLLLALALMITACGEANPFVGSWKGTCDLTDYIIDSVVGDDETMAAYMKEVDGLEFVINFEFTEDEMSMSVDEASLDTFVANFETSLMGMMEALLIDELAGYGISYEEYVAESGMDSEALMESMMDEMNLTTMMNTMVDSMAEALELNGAYMYDDGVLTIVYEDNTYEEMKYVFDEETLTITVVAEEGTEFPIICEMQK